MLELVDPTAYWFNWYAVPPALVTTLIFATGLFVFLQNRTSATHISFFFFCLTLNFWLYGISLVYCSKTPELALRWYRWITFLGVAHISPTVYTFSVHWLGLYKKQRRFVIASFLLAPVFYLLALFTPYGMPYVQKYFWGYYPSYGIVGRIFLLFFFGYFLAAFFNFFSQLRKQAVPLRRKQIQIVSVAYLISLTGSIDYLPKLFYLPLYPIGFLSVLIWTLIVAYSIVRYRMMDIETVIHKTIMWGFTSLLFALPLVVLSYFGKDWLAHLNPVWFSMVAFVFVLFFISYARFVQPKIDHIFQRRRWDLARVLEKFTDELVHLRELDELTSHILETIRSAFYVQEGSLLLSKDEDSPFECVKSLPHAKSFRFERKAAFLRWLEDNDTLVVEEYLDLDPKYHSIRQEAKAYFEVVNSHLCVPFLISGRLLGVINIGQKANLRPFTTTEINFLSDLRKTAAIALSNSLRSVAMQESLRRWNVELEKKVDERTKELKDTQAQLIQAEKLASIGTLAGGIAHEINNPLTAVLTNVQMLKMLNEAEDDESLSLIEQGAKRCQQIIQKLMRYARKTDETEIFETVDINKTIRSVCDFLDYQLKQDDISLDLSMNPVESIVGVPNELEQVFTNLILNAKDAIKSSGRKGKIEIRTESKDGRVHIEVADNGVGIKKGNLVRVFDPFYTTKDVGEGTGLGLTVSSGIVQKHRGKISVNSKENQGTTFMIEFPFAKQKPAPTQ